MSKPEDEEKDVRRAEVVNRGKEDGPWTLTDALTEAFVLGYETAERDAHKDVDDALEDADVADRIGRIHEKFGSDAISAMEDLLDMEPEE